MLSELTILRRGRLALELIFYPNGNLENLFSVFRYVSNMRNLTILINNGPCLTIVVINYVSNEMGDLAILIRPTSCLRRNVRGFQLRNSVYLQAGTRDRASTLYRGF